MSTPFFSIDFKNHEWLSYLQGSLGLNFEKDIDNLIKKRFPGKNFLKFPSSRMGFYFFLEQSYEPGDEIIFSAMSFPLYIKMAIQLGLKPILIDVEDQHLSIDTKLIEKNITKKTKAIVTTHLFGHPGKMKELVDISKNYGLQLIEDCAQSIDSFSNKIETGNFGYAAFFSTGLVKIPTTLGGGFLITENADLIEKINLRLKNKKYNATFNKVFPIYLKNLVSILNSYPFLYSILSHKILAFLNKRNPELLRKIFYSGMGTDTFFNPWERPKQLNYQFSVGCSQFQRIREMTNIRRRNSAILDNILKDVKYVNFFKEDINCYWNHHYYTLIVEKGLPEIYNQMFRKGVHLLIDDVWDCSDYGFDLEIRQPLNVTKFISKKLIRIPNNSYLSEQSIENIGLNIKQILSEL